MNAPYYADDNVRLYLGDCREVVPALGETFDLIVADPPYQSTSLKWDRWPEGWPEIVGEATRSMWCFGSPRMFMDRRGEFTRWRYSHDVIWEKHNGSGPSDGRFFRVHEQVSHWYQGPWVEIYASVPKDRVYGVDKSTRRQANAVPHRNRDRATVYDDDRSRVARSVLKVRSMHGHAIHPTQKPLGIVDPLIEFGCPVGGTVLAPFSGSGSVLVAARDSGRRAVGVEGVERIAEQAAKRLQANSLFAGGAA